MRSILDKMNHSLKEIEQLGALDAADLKVVLTLQFFLHHAWIKCSKGHMIIVMQNVTLNSFQTGQFVAGKSKARLRWNAVFWRLCRGMQVTPILVPVARRPKQMPGRGFSICFSLACMYRGMGYNIWLYTFINVFQSIIHDRHMVFSQRGRNPGI